LSDVAAVLWLQQLNGEWLECAQFLNDDRVTTPRDRADDVYVLAPKGVAPEEVYMKERGRAKTISFVIDGLALKDANAANFAHDHYRRGHRYTVWRDDEGDAHVVCNTCRESYPVGLDVEDVDGADDVRPGVVWMRSPVGDFSDPKPEWKQMMGGPTIGDAAGMLRRMTAGAPLDHMTDYIVCFEGDDPEEQWQAQRLQQGVESVRVAVLEAHERLDDAMSTPKSRRFDEALRASLNLHATLVSILLEWAEMPPLIRNAVLEATKEAKS